MTYATLQTDIASYLHRTDLTAKIPGFISLAEAFLFRELSIKGEETSVDGVTVDGYAELPTDFLTLTKLSMTYNGAARLLDYAPQSYVPTSSNDNAIYYALENGKLRVYGTDDGAAYTMYYIPTIPALSASQTTNWLLDNAPDLYLYASSLEGAKYVRNVAEVQYLSGLVPSLLDSVRRSAERKGQPTGGSLQIKVRR